jgi:hypothetical protein
MGFDLVARANESRPNVLMNLLEEEEDKVKMFGNTLVMKHQLVQHVPENSCFKAHIKDETQNMYEWLCHHDLISFWDHKCLLGICDEPGIDEFHKLFLGQCVSLDDAQVCPGEVHHVRDL